MELPELPKLAGTAFDRLYTADQMRDFARQAVALERERCANVCLDYAKRHDKGDDESKAQAWMMLQCAVAIRKEPQ